MKRLTFLALLLLVVFSTQQVLAAPAPVQQTPPPAQETQPEPEPAPVVTPDPEPEPESQTQEPAPTQEASNQDQQQNSGSSVQESKTSAPSSNASERAEANGRDEDLEDCKALATEEERIKCRLRVYPNVTPQQIDNDTPESCRDNGRSDEWNATCAETYASFRHCWALPHGNGRVDCVKEALGLPQQLEAGSDAKKITWLIIYRLYEAEERSAIFYQDGKITLDQHVAFSMEITAIKKKFYTAATKEEKRALIREAIKAFNELVATFNA